MKRQNLFQILTVSTRILTLFITISVQDDSFHSNIQKELYEDHLKRADEARCETSFTPTILLAIFVRFPTPFLKEQLEKVKALDYPKKKMHLFIYNDVAYHTAIIKSFRKKMIREYGTVVDITPSDGSKNAMAGNKVAKVLIEYGQKVKCDFYFHVTSTAHLDNPEILKMLIGEDKMVVAPLLVSPDEARSSLLVSANDDYYLASFMGSTDIDDYLFIEKDFKEKLGKLRVVQSGSECFLMASRFMKGVLSKIIDYGILDTLGGTVPELYFSNVTYFGHLVNAFNFNMSNPSPEMYEIFYNPVDWEAKYIHQLYACNFRLGNMPFEPCLSVIWLPLVKSVFCKDLIRMADTYIRSADTHKISQVQDTFKLLDIFFEDLRWKLQFRYFFRKYVLPLGVRYYEDFLFLRSKKMTHYVVKYNTSERYSSLDLHVDNSEYSVTMELSQYGIDYDGGGCRYEVNNCTAPSRPGWILIHPGDLEHEGLRVTRGNRYVLVCFIEPIQENNKD